MLPEWTYLQYMMNDIYKKIAIPRKTLIATTAASSAIIFITLLYRKRRRTDITTQRVKRFPQGKVKKDL